MSGCAVTTVVDVGCKWSETRSEIQGSVADFGAGGGRGVDGW